MERKISIILPIHNEKDSLPIMVRLLNYTIKLPKEIIIVYDDNNDNAIEVAKSLENELEDVKVLQNKISPGVRFAVEAGINASKHDIILITAVDEIFPIVAVEKMIDFMISKELDFVSGTRYSGGGVRLGGSFLGSVFSRTANFFFKFLTNIPFTDCTTGIKLMKKNVWKSIDLESKPIGWAYSFELAIKVFLKGYNVGEFPLKSVDRLFGGSSTFKFGPWLKEYLRWFFWGLKKIKNKN